MLGTQRQLKDFKSIYLFFENQIVKIYNFERKISALCLLDKLVKICGAAS